jgi:hypothetical protein
MISNCWPPRRITFFAGEISSFGVLGPSGESGKKSLPPLRLNGLVSILIG